MPHTNTHNEARRDFHSTVVRVLREHVRNADLNTSLTPEERRRARLGRVLLISEVGANYEKPIDSIKIDDIPDLLRALELDAGDPIYEPVLGYWRTIAAGWDE